MRRFGADQDIVIAVYRAHRRGYDMLRTRPASRGDGSPTPATLAPTPIVYDMAANDGLPPAACGWAPHRCPRPGKSAWGRRRLGPASVCKVTLCIFGATSLCFH